MSAMGMKQHRLMTVLSERLFAFRQKEVEKTEDDKGYIIEKCEDIVSDWQTEYAKDLIQFSPDDLTQVIIRAALTSEFWLKDRIKETK